MSSKVFVKLSCDKKGGKIYTNAERKKQIFVLASACEIRMRTPTEHGH